MTRTHWITFAFDLAVTPGVFETCIVSARVDLDEMAIEFGVAGCPMLGGQILATGSAEILALVPVAHEGDFIAAAVERAFQIDCESREEMLC